MVEPIKIRGREFSPELLEHLNGLPDSRRLRGI